MVDSIVQIPGRRNVAIRIEMEKGLSTEDTKQEIAEMLQKYTNASILLLVGDVQSVSFVGSKYPLEPTIEQHIIEKGVEELKAYLKQQQPLMNVDIQAVRWQEIVDTAYIEKLALTESTYSMMRDFHNAVVSVVEEMFSEHQNQAMIDSIVPQILGEMMCLLHGVHFNDKVYEFVETKKPLQDLAELIRKGKAWPWIMNGVTLSKEEIAN